MSAVIYASLLNAPLQMPHLLESGAPAYFFEYQHRPTSYTDNKPEYVKADHGDEVGFVFGGPFLAGDIQLRSKEQNIKCSPINYCHNTGVILFSSATSILIKTKGHILTMRPKCNLLFNKNVLFSPFFIVCRLLFLKHSKLHVVDNLANKTFAKKHHCHCTSTVHEICQTAFAEK